MTAEWITIGQVLKPHGYQGEVKVRSMTDIPNRFKSLKRVWLEWPDGRRQEFQVERWRPSHGGQLMKMQSVNDPETAGSLRGAYIQVPRSDIAPLPPEQYYVFEMIGLRVVMESGREVGELQEVIPLPVHDVYVVRGPSGEVLIPAIHEIVVGIDVAARRMVIRPIPGLIEEP